jgi:hypothetical protein
MDLFKIIRELYEERQRIEEAIARLEALPSRGRKELPAALPRRRGRKSMDPAERLEVSRRMKEYWERRRAKAQPPGSPKRAD